MRRPEKENIGVKHGVWGENVAVEFLRRGGFAILDRNSRPVKKNRTLEIDIVALERATDTVVFVEVKQHSSISPYSRRLRSVGKKKKLNLLRACNAWRRSNRWEGGYRFDVIEVYGVPEGGPPVIDHIERVELFARRGKFVKWT